MVALEGPVQLAQLARPQPLRAAYGLRVHFCTRLAPSTRRTALLWITLCAIGFADDGLEAGMRRAELIQALNGSTAIGQTESLT